MVFSTGEILLRVTVSFLLIVINSFLIHYIAEKLKFNDNSYDNPTTIAIILSILFLFITYINFKSILFLVTIITMGISVKYFYNVDWEEAIKLVIIWLIGFIILSFAIVSILFILVF